jgi:hypothetical protein
MSALSIHRNGKKLRIKSVEGGACHRDMSATFVCGEFCAKDLRFDTKVSARDSDVHAYIYICEEVCAKDLNFDIKVSARDSDVHAHIYLYVRRIVQKI